jgi:N4-(beta-N-acetylglucosaminyl)-L-asparaginase
MRPLVIASANGHEFTNGGDQTCVERAFALMASGADPVDALVEGVSIVELDPGDTSVGFGALPNADGVVQLDACCMEGSRRRAGGVAALEGVATAAAVAARVMRDTSHHLLAGAGAQSFARSCGFSIAADLNSERSRALWKEWKRRLDGHGAGADPSARAEAGYAIGLDMSREGLLDPNHLWGTIHCSALTPDGALAGVTTTSGLAWKMPGRVGDSPILGAGLYVRAEAGAAGSTGRGESNLYSLSSFFIVDAMRRGAHPKDAALEALRQIVADTTAPALLNGRGRPNFNVKFYVLNARGDYAGVALYGGDAVRLAVCTDNGAELRPCDALLDGPMLD